MAKFASNWKRCLVCVVVVMCANAVRTQMHQQQQQQQPIVSNVTMTVIVNTTVTLPCRPIKTAPVLWTRNTPTVQQDIAYNGIPINGFATKITLTVSNGWHNLTWNRIDFNDDTIYYCLEDNGAGLRHRIRLLVIGEPAAVKTTQTANDPLVRPLLQEPTTRNSPAPHQARSEDYERLHTTVIVIAVLLAATMVAVAIGFALYIGKKYNCCHRRGKVTAQQEAHFEMEVLQPEVAALTDNNHDDVFDEHSRPRPAELIAESDRGRLIENNGDVRLPLEMLQLIIMKATVQFRKSLGLKKYETPRIADAEAVAFFVNVCIKWWSANDKYVQRHLRRAFHASPQLVFEMDDAGRRGVRGIASLHDQLFVTSYSSSEVEVYANVPPFGKLNAIAIDGLDVPCELSAYPGANEIKLIDHNGGCEWVIDAAQHTVVKNSGPQGRVPVTSSLTSGQNRFIYDINGARKETNLPESFSSNHAVEIAPDRILVAERSKARVVVMDSKFVLVRVLLNEKHFLPRNDEPWRLCYVKESRLLFVGMRNRGVRVYNGTV